ncbi:aldehyde dehydrogenase family protein [Oceanobacillus salinisoli]|uniref:aldehyde dehydrogenase family protein n=1 Tax=Oceanobacillus salinisoli TaxID=2678611 RepID=UPI0012E12768|nr:aldehyde dehydrogenase family protein [Oceanobacillus salinisoli]
MLKTEEKSIFQTELKRDAYQMVINGRLADAETGEVFTVYNPATGEAIGEVPKAGKKDVDLAVEAARHAFDYGKWKKYPVGKRARVLNKIASIMRSRFNELVEIEILNSGKTLAAAQGQVSQAIEDFEFYAGAIVGHRGEVNNVPGRFFNYTQKEPVGVAAQIIPWNYPMMMAAWKIAPAIAAGCSVVLKPASLTPITAIILTEICHEAGVPEGVVNVITGPGGTIGSYLAEHEGIDKVAFTGETATGKDIMSNASKTLKRVTLELGGKSPNLVFPDTDLEAAVNGSLFGIFYNTGQSCEARSRLFVHEDIYETFMEQFVAKTRKLVAGDPFSENTHIGAIISKSQLDKIHQHVENAVKDGATVVTGGHPLEIEGYENGYWYAPTIITNVTNDMRIAQDEIFGPVVVVMKFKDEKEAIKLGNDTEYGLAASIWAKDQGLIKRVSDGLQAGIVMVNCPFSAFPGTPFGGYKQSGFGRELSVETLDLYTETKSVLSYSGSKPLNPLNV